MLKKVSCEGLLENKLLSSMKNRIRSQFIFADILKGIVPRGKVGCHEVWRHSSCFSFFEKGIPLR